jgi:hypothetical protein
MPEGLDARGPHIHRRTEGDTHMHAKALTIAGLCALVAALALPASGAAGTPPTVETVNYTVTFSTSACGIDNLVETDHSAGVMKTDPTGQMSMGGHFEYILTNPANGKALKFEASGSGTAPDSPDGIPNGDGTYTFHFALSGMFKYSSLSGGPLESGSGHFAVVAVLDSSFNVISVRVHSGGSTPGNNNDPCPLVVSALT